jgi:hypothetical protein
MTFARHIGTWLLSAVALTACAQPPPSAPSETPTAAAAVTPATQDSTRKDEAPMAAVPQSAQPVSTAAIRQQVLDVLGGLSSPAALREDELARRLGVPLRADPEWDRRHTFEGKTTEGWPYSFAVTTTDPAGISDLDLSLGDTDVPPDGSSATLCAIAFEGLSKDIIALGFTRTPDRIRMKGKTWWGFQKRIPEQNLVVGAMVYVYPVDNGNQDCVNWISIGGEAIDE